GGSFCGRDCAAESCPPGYLCSEVEAGDASALQCVPLNGTCDCDGDSAGAVKGCQVTNELGTCFGEETCDPVAGWSGCTAAVPAEEACNGSDDDCDGATDEGFTPSACSSTSEHGTCTGVESCQGASGWVCSAKTPAAESCNGADDDCDSDVDEDFLNALGQYVHVEHCGACGNDCLSKFAGAAEVLCDDSGWSPVCVLVACAPGYVMFNASTCLDEDAFQCTPCQEDADCFGELSRCLQLTETDPRTFCFRDCSGQSPFSTTCGEGYACQPMEEGALCLPVNDSCDCLASNAGQTKACILENELGICFGQETCDPAVGWTGCTAALPAAELCNGLDDDCDGLLDEDLPPGAACQETNEHGTCTGMEVCTGLGGMACNAAVPAAETCNGKDDDCDGAVDDGFAIAAGNPPVLKYGLSVEHCGACNHACPPVASGEPACDPLPPIPLCVVGSCDPGTFNYLGVACLPLPTENLCLPCSSDAECQGPDDKCIPGEPFGWCARDCAPGSIYDSPGAPCSWNVAVQGCCPEGFLCSQLGAGRQCVPASEDCSCIVDGVVEACSLTNAHGTCFGSRTCALAPPAPGWTPCSAATPAPEACNGLDDDCDGIIDGQDPSLDFAGTPDGGPACTTGPACSGSWSCTEGAWVCSATTPAPEACNGLDDDCDGLADEDFLQGGLYLHEDHCGACGYDCGILIPGSVDPVCVLEGGLPLCVAEDCEPGSFPYGGGQVCMTLPDNLCQPCTDHGDCLVPGSLCLDAAGERFCGRDCAPGSLYGPTCPPGYACVDVPGASQCAPESGSCVCGPGSVGLVRSCTAGACAGQQVCQFTGAVYVFSPCSAEGLVPEVCDGLDNDCDGEPDEGFLGPGGAYDTDGDCGVCGNDCTVQINAVVHHGTAACDPGLNPPACVLDTCVTEVVGGQTWEWVDVNAALDDGCECRRAAGTTDDPPDVDFPTAGQPGFPLPAAVYEDSNCDGVDGVEADALFVSAAAAPGGDGTRAAPFRTIGEALDVFPLSNAAYILVAAGVYVENLRLEDGVQLHGGYAEDFLSRNIVLFETEIQGDDPLPGDAAQAPIHVEDVTGPGGVLVSGFILRARDVQGQQATGPGSSSVAVLLLDCDGHVALRNCTILGGLGGAGATGSGGGTGFGTQSPGGTVLHGSAGLNAGACVASCTTETQAGGAGGTNPQCTAAGAPKGGGVVCPEYNQPGYHPTNPGHDGTPGFCWTFDSASSNSCTGHATEAGYPTAIKKLDGGDGLPGADGSSGLQGNGCALAAGTFTGGQWVGGTGAVGSLGAHGQAGGAGGASGGIDSAPQVEMPAGVTAKSPPRFKIGATGGGGGAGGCRGGAGGGGATGGASIGVLVGWTPPVTVSSPPILATNRIARGYGGAGGSGGYGGLGGVGGDGGKGGNSQGFWVDWRAGAGGRGGSGGSGGGGGGGCGGASFGVAVFHHPAGWALDYGTSNTFDGPAGSSGGPGGAGGPSGLPNPVSGGADGASADLHAVPAP
ncbi:MAG: hypothetical protein FJ098_01980, partial [Deltaproteobacteria bacterium]|nr:hypothetical protein [Deltaproteobacteria bacterium]